MTSTPKISLTENSEEDIGVTGSVAKIWSEEALVAALRDNDDRGYEELIRTCGPLVLSVARRYMRSEADAADCFQETFIAVMKGIDGYGEQSSVCHWVRGIAVNSCLMALRKRKRSREESIEHMMPQFDESGKRIRDGGSHRPSAVETILDDRALQGTVRHSIQKLPDDYRVILLLRDIDGYSTREAANILDISISAVKTRLHRARTALRYILEPLLERTADADV